MREFGLNDEKDIGSMEREQILAGSTKVPRPRCIGAHQADEGNEGNETAIDAQWRCPYQMIHHATYLGYTRLRQDVREVTPFRDFV